MIQRGWKAVGVLGFSVHTKMDCTPPINGSETSPLSHQPNRSLIDRGTGEDVQNFPGISAREPTYSTLLGAELVVISMVLAWPGIRIV